MYRWCICGIGKKLESANLGIITYQSDCSWWFQPIWKKCSSNWIMKPQGSGWKFKKYLSCHHPGFYWINLAGRIREDLAQLARLIGSSLRIPTILILTCDGPTSNRLFTGIHIDPIWALSIYSTTIYRGHESLHSQPKQWTFIRDLNLPYICIVWSPQNW